MSERPSKPPQCSSPMWWPILKNEIDQFPRMVEELLDDGTLHEHLDCLSRLANNAMSVAGELDAGELAASAAFRENPKYDPDKPGELSPRHQKMLDDLLERCDAEHRQP